MGDIDVCIIGGGQAGLSTAFYLRRTNRERERGGLAPLSTVVLDARENPGGAWVDGWPSLHLFSPAAYSSLPGWQMPAWTGSDTPPASHVVAYLAAYEQRYDLPVRRPVRVTKVTEAGASDAEASGRLAVHTDAGTWLARAVVNTTGTWDRPFVPTVPGMAVFTGRQLHTHQYAGPEAFAGLKVAVVGGGNSGAQIAADLLPVAGRVHWVTSQPPRYLGDDVDGRVLFETATRAVADRAAGRPSKGVASLGDIVAVPAVRQARDRDGLRARPMFAHLTATGAVWPNGSTADLDAIVWATGFRPALRHLRHLGLATRDGHPCTLAPEGSPHPTRSASDPRVWFVGYGDWTGPASATLIGVSRPARDTAEAITAGLSAEVEL